MRNVLSLIIPLSLVLACTDGGDDPTDAGTTDSGATTDGGAGDGGTSDGGAGDGGAGDGGSGDGGSGDGGSADDAMIRVVHGSPGAPAVDVWVAGGDAPVIEDLTYGEATGYLSVPEGDYVFQVKASPSTASDAAVYETGSLTLPAGAVVTAAAWGELGATGATAFTVTPFVEDWSDAPSGTFLARIVHASPDAPAVDLDVGNDGTAEITGFAYGDDTDSLVPGGVPLPADVETAVGIWAGGERVTAFTVPALPEGTQVFVFADGYLADLPREETGLLLLAVPDSGDAVVIRQDPRVYALHGSPDAPPVDLFVGDTEIAGDVAFGELAGPVQVPPAAYTIDFFVAAEGSTRPDGDPAVSATTPALEAGQTYLAMANGFLTTDPGFELLAWAEGFATNDADNVRVRVVHGSPDAPAVEVGPIMAGEVSSLGAFAYGEDSGPAGVSVPAVALSIGLALEGTVEPVLSFPVDLTGAEGARAFAIAAGSLGGTGAPFGLILVDTSTSPWSIAQVAPE